MSENAINEASTLKSQAIDFWSHLSNKNGHEHLHSILYGTRPIPKI